MNSLERTTKVNKCLNPMVTASLTKPSTLDNLCAKRVQNGKKIHIQTSSTNSQRSEITMPKAQPVDEIQFCGYDSVHKLKASLQTPHLVDNYHQRGDNTFMKLISI